MKKIFIIAGIIAVLTCGFTYFEYLPSYLSVTISICSFIAAMTISIISAIQNFQHSNKEGLESSLGVLQKSFSSVADKLSLISNNIDNVKLENISNHERIQVLLGQTETVIKEVVEKILQLDGNFTSFYKGLTQTIGEKTELMTDSLNNNSKEISSLSETLNSTTQKVSDDVIQFKEEIHKTTTELSEIVKKAINDLAERVNDINAKFIEFGSYIEVFNNSAVSIKESNNALSKDYSEAISLVNKSISSISLQNKRSIDDLKDSLKESIEDLLNGVKDVSDAQTETFSETGSCIKNSIDILCNSLTNNIKKLAIDIDAICNSVEDMKQMSQYVGQSDKDLLAKISEICK